MNLAERHPLLPEIRTLAPSDFVLPETFADLRVLAYNMWWSWTPEARIFHSAAAARARCIRLAPRLRFAPVAEVAELADAHG